MKNIELIVLFFFAQLNLHAQWIYQHNYGNNRNERCQSSISMDNGFLLNGATTSFGSGDVDALIIRTDPAGSILWAQSCGIINSHEIPYYALKTFDNNFVFAGTIGSPVSGSPVDALIFKTDSSGNFLWAQSYGGINHETAVNIAELSDHNYCFIGSTESYGNGLSDILFVKTDTNGDTLYTRMYGSADSEQGKSFTQTTDGGFLLCGKSLTYPGSLPVYMAILIRIDASGNLIWSKLYGDSLFQEAQSAVQTPDGGFLICGSRDKTGNGNYDVLVFKTDSMGNVAWSKTYGGHKGEAAYTLLKCPDNTFVISGYTNSLGYGHQRGRNFLNSFKDNPVQRSSTKQTNYILGDDSTNVFLMKIDLFGDTIWTRSYGDSLQEEGFLSEKTPDGGFMISGFSDYHNSDSSQMLVIKTDEWGHSGCYELTAHPNIWTDSLSYRTANYTQSSGLAYHSITLTSTSRVIEDSTYCLFTGIHELSKSNLIELYPNPVNDKLFVRNHFELSGNDEHSLSISVYNSIGQKTKDLHFDKIQSDLIEINVSFLQPGIYFLYIQNQKMRVIRPFIKE